MKLNLVNAGTGATWVKLGIQTFFRRPVAMMGLFLTFMASMSVLTLVPVLGLPLAMMLLPAATLGLMLATFQVTQGIFPMPLILLSAFRTHNHTTNTARAVLTLGLIYSAGFLTAMGVTILIDGGGFASLYLGGSTPTSALMQSSEFQQAMWAFVCLHLPLSLMVWHAPALVFWHGLPVLKSLFFSVVACFRNFWAFTVFGVIWMTIMVLTVMFTSTLSAFWGVPALSGSLMFLSLMLVASMFFCSLYFTFRDCFSDTAPQPVDQLSTPLG